MVKDGEPINNLFKNHISGFCEYLIEKVLTKHSKDLLTESLERVEQYRSGDREFFINVLNKLPFGALFSTLYAPVFMRLVFSR